jgi:hypothetical protein
MFFYIGDVQCPKWCGQECFINKCPQDAPCYTMIYDGYYRMTFSKGSFKNDARQQNVFVDIYSKLDKNRMCSKLARGDFRQKFL